MSDHVVVLQHGILGTTGDLRHIGRLLWFWHNGHLRIVLSDVNVKRTLDGVELGGQRLANLIKQSVPLGGSLSLVCHSLGGIYGRKALAILEKENWFSVNNVTAANFITLASPHLGIPEIERAWRAGIKLFGGVIGATVCDLGLRTNVVLELSEEECLQGLGRFRRRAVYGNADDDMWVRPCSAMILPAIPDMNLTDGEPARIKDGGNPIDVEFAELATFPEKYREVVRRMLAGLCKLSWERYIVRFPFESWSGAAHIKICLHQDDSSHSGENLAAHICQTFSLSERGQMASESHCLEPKIFRMQERSVRETQTPEGANTPRRTDVSVPDLPTFSCFALKGLRQSTGTWIIDTGRTMDEVMQWIHQHNGISRGVVKISIVEGCEQAEWCYSWFPRNNWHKLAIVEKIREYYPSVTGNVDSVRNDNAGYFQQRISYAQ